MFKPIQRWAILAALALCCTQGTGNELAVLRTEDRLALQHERFLQSRRASLVARQNPFLGPSLAQVIEEYPAPWKQSTYPWHHQIGATVFWVGELPTENNPTSNVASAWNPNWMESFGGVDDPIQRSGSLPFGFVPRENPFYFALPYNDLAPNGRHRPEAQEVIPWFWRDFKDPSVSVCKDRWIAIHHKDAVCYAQWKDVGPFSVDDWEYVFEGKKPRPNRNSDAGLDVSPAVRDYLALRGFDRVSWRFVEEAEVPAGPWRDWMNPRSVSVHERVEPQRN